MRPKLTRRALSASDREHWDRNGFLVLPHLFSARRVDVVDALVDAAWDERRDASNPLVVDVLGGPLKDRRMYLRDVDRDARRHPYKLNDLYLESGPLRDLALDRRLAGILRELLGGDPAICNSLNFERGSQQEYHFDTYYMPGPCPGGLVVTSICLEDVHPDAGPLTYYPGSHEIPPYRFSHGGVHAAPDEMPAATEYVRREIAERALVAEDFAGRKGDVFIWHEQLYHGGKAIRDLSRTRKSLVTHYWRADGLNLAPGWELRRHERDRYFLARPHQSVAQVT